jgi:hypothetical protein
MGPEQRGQEGLLAGREDLAAGQGRGKPLPMPAGASPGGKLRRPGRPAEGDSWQSLQSRRQRINTL